MADFQSPSDKDKENPLLAPDPNAPKPKPRKDAPAAGAPVTGTGPLPVPTDASRKASVELATPLAEERASTVKDNRPRDQANAAVAHPAAGPVPSTPEAQDEALRAAVEAERAARDKGGTKEVSGKARRPMLAGVMDLQTGSVFTAGNTSAPPEELHPLMAKRLDEQRKMFDLYQKLGDKRPDFQSMKPEEMQKFLKDNGIPESQAGLDPAEQLKLLDERMKFKQQQLTEGEDYAALPPDKKKEAMLAMWKSARGEIGTHGEFNALNAALLKRQEELKAQGIDKELSPDDLKTFLLHNTASTKPDADHPPGTMPRCHHCEVLTGGVQTTPKLQNADKNRSDPGARS